MLIVIGKKHFENAGNVEASRRLSAKQSLVGSSPTPGSNAVLPGEIPGAAVDPQLKLGKFRRVR